MVGMDEPRMDPTDLDALRDLYRTERTRLLAFARGLCGDLETAEDALHSAFERLLRRGSAPRELRPFVYRSVRNAAIDACRRRNHRTPEASTPEEAVYDPSVEEELELSLALQRLPQRERVAVVLCLVAGFTAREAGELLGMSSNTVSTRRRRGLERLRKRLEGA